MCGNAENKLEKKVKKKSTAALIALSTLSLLMVSASAETEFLTNNSTPKTLDPNQADGAALDGATSGTDTILTFSADDGAGSTTLTSVSVSGGQSLFMDGTSMGHGNTKWGANQNWTFTFDEAISFDALDFQNNENAYSLRSVAWKDDASASGTGWSFSSDGTIGIFSLSSGQLYDFTSAGVSDVPAGTEIGFGAFGSAGGGDLLMSFTITPVPQIALSPLSASVAENAPLGTLVAELIVDGTNGVFTFAIEPGSDAGYFDIPAATTNLLRTADWLDQASFDINIIATESGGGGLVLTNSFSVSAEESTAIYVVDAEVSSPVTNGQVVGTAKMTSSGAAFSIVGGRTDLFYFDDDTMRTTNASSWGAVGSTNYVTIRAVNGSSTNDLVVATSVVSGAAEGSATVFRFL